MSNIRIFGPDGYPVGEVVANCNRGWAINSGATSTITLSAERVMKPWLYPGCFALIEHPDLPAWAGVIDTDWRAILPVQLTVYDIPYILKQRIPDTSLTLKGGVGYIIQQLILEANKAADTMVRPGNLITQDKAITQVIDQRTVWDQMVEISGKYGFEITFDPSVNSANQLIVTLDVKLPKYDDPVVMLHDGLNGTIKVTDCVVGGSIYNRVIGTSDESTVKSRKVYGPITDDVSIGLYGLRSTVAVFNGIKSISDLETATRAYLAAVSRPAIKMTTKVLDRNVFHFLRIGNTLRIRASEVYLPGGGKGWEGITRVTAMTYDESENTVSLSMEGRLYE